MRTHPACTTTTLAITCALIASCGSSPSNTPEFTSNTQQLNDTSASDFPNITAGTGTKLATATSLTARTTKTNTNITLTSPQISATALDGLHTIMLTGAAIGTPHTITTDQPKTPLTIRRTFNEPLPDGTETFFITYNPSYSYWEPRAAKRTPNRKRIAASATTGTWTDVLYVTDQQDFYYLRSDDHALSPDADTYTVRTALIKPWEKTAKQDNANTPDSFTWLTNSDQNTNAGDADCTTPLPEWVENLTPQKLRRNTEGPISWCIGTADTNPDLVEVNISITGKHPLVVTSATQPTENSLTPGNITLTNQLHNPTKKHTESANIAGTRLVLDPGQTLQLRYSQKELPKNLAQSEKLISFDVANPAEYMAHQIMNTLVGSDQQQNQAVASATAQFMSACGRHITKIDDGPISYTKLKTCLENQAPTTHNKLSTAGKHNGSSPNPVDATWVVSNIMTAVGTLTFAKKAPRYARNAKTPTKPRHIGLGSR